MEWIGLLAVIGLMVAMHRFGMGCCGGHGHGGHGGDTGSTRDEEGEKEPESRPQGPRASAG